MCACALHAAAKSSDTARTVDYHAIRYVRYHTVEEPTVRGFFRTVGVM